MIDYRKKIWMCLLGSLLATGAIAALVAYSFAAAPAAYLNERAPMPGQLNALLVSEAGPVVDVFVPPLAGLPGVDVTVDPGGVDVTVNPACPPGGCPEPEDPYAGRYDEDSAEYDAYADEGGGGDRKLFKGGFLKKIFGKLRGGEGPLRRLLGKLRGGR